MTAWGLWLVSEVGGGAGSLLDCTFTFTFYVHGFRIELNWILGHPDGVHILLGVVCVGSLPQCWNWVSEQQFTRAATQSTKTGWLKHSFFVSQFWKLEVEEQGLCRVMLPPKGLEKNPSLPFLASSGWWQSWHSLAFQMCNSNLYFCFPVAFSFVCLCLCSQISLFLLDSELTLFQYDLILTW